MEKLSGKVVVLTGAAGGQGSAEAAAFVREGATVIATDIHDPPDSLASLPGPGSLVYRQLDVAQPGDWAALGAWLGSEVERVDGLVNNAGVTHRAALAEVDLEDWNRVLGVNLTGALLGIQTIVPYMTNGGSIVNIGSIAALTAHASSAYTVSKWGLRGLSRVASLELGPRRIRVNAIHPGYIETAMTASAPVQFREANLREIPLDRLGTIEDVAPLVVFLLSDESSYITGVEIPVDGGHTGHGGAKSIADALRGAPPYPE